MTCVLGSCSSPTYILFTESRTVHKKQRDIDFIHRFDFSFMPDMANLANKD